jgi:hypothetical protein
MPKAHPELLYMESDAVSHYRLIKTSENTRYTQ